MPRTKLSSAPFVKLRADGVLKSVYMCRFCPFFHESRTAVEDHESGHFVDPATAEPGCSKCRFCSFVCPGGGASLMGEHVKFHKMTVDILEYQHGSPLAKAARKSTSGLVPKNSSLKRPQAPVLLREPEISVLNFCPYCPFAIERPEMFAKHIDCHVIANRYKCSKCTYSCVNPVPTKFHDLVHDDEYQAKHLKSKWGARRMQSSEWPMREHHKRLYRMVGMDPDKMEQQLTAPPVESPLDEPESPPPAKKVKHVRIVEPERTPCVFDFLQLT
jgi:ferredoxin